jgi:hypothetical protein
VLKRTKSLPQAVGKCMAGTDHIRSSLGPCRDPGPFWRRSTSRFRHLPRFPTCRRHRMQWIGVPPLLSQVSRVRWTRKGGIYRRPPSLRSTDRCKDRRLVMWPAMPRFRELANEQFMPPE